MLKLEIKFSQMLDVYKDYFTFSLKGTSALWMYVNDDQYSLLAFTMLNIR